MALGMTTRLTTLGRTFSGSLMAALLAAGCAPGQPGSGNDNTDGKAEAWDDINAPSLFGLTSMTLAEIQQPGALSGYLVEKPWSDTYWPLNQKGVAHRWNGDSSWQSFDDQKQDAVNALANAESYEATWKLSPAEKYDILVGDPEFSLTKQGWDEYAKYEDYEFSWGWMGHCHGWAPAAYLEKTPQAGVMVDIDGKKMLFTEGDIRGLLTKAWATNDTLGGTRFMGGRCNARTMEKDQHGRIVDGTLWQPSEADPKKANTETDTTIYIDRNFWSQYYLLTFTESPGSTDIKVMQATEQAEAPEGAFVVRIYASIDDYYSQTVERTAIFNYTKSCRDTNPGSFHLAVVQYLSDLNAPEDKRGFVVDVTRTDQVWNQPVYGFESTITSVQNVSDIEDPLAELRAEGTVQIANVETKLHYGLERGPYVDYSESSSSNITSKTFRYSLEIDKDGYIIGGEWESSSSAPDFLWAPQGGLKDSALVKYSPIKKIHDCSLEVDRARTLALPGGQEIQVVDCEL